MKNPIIFLLLGLLLLAVPDITAAEGPTMCTMQYEPVCGTRDSTYKTYGNNCALSSEDATYQHEGECTALELSGRQQGTYAPPASCTAWFDGCNRCSRSAGGQSMCTLMACMGEPHAGYCTAYGDVETIALPAPSGPVSSDTAVSGEVSLDATTSVEIGTTTEPAPGFFSGIWRAVSAWFRGIFPF